MVKSGFSKLKNRRGETLIESLVAILAFTLSSIVMYSMITASAEINYSARKADEDFQAKLVYVEKAAGGEGGTTRNANVNVTLIQSPNGSGSCPMGSVKVKIFVSDELIAYYPIPKGGG